MSNLILLSGGIDSALCLFKYGAALAMHFDYGQRSKDQERECATSIARADGLPLQIVELPKLPRTPTVVFGRNAVMLAIAAARAQELGLNAVIIGCNADDATEFPDCRPDFIAGMDAAFSSAYGVRVVAPIIAMSKRDVLETAKVYPIPTTWTCYTPTVNGDPCGQCHACKVMNSAQ